MDSRSLIGVRDKLRGSDVIFDFLRDHQYWLTKKYPLVIGSVMASELAVSGRSFENTLSLKGV